MSDYIKITDYAAKDALLSGNPAKLVKGAEIDADFDAVAVAVATKANTLDKLSAFAATTSAELAGVISDETGSGALVFATSPILVTPLLGTPTSGTLTNCTGLPQAGTVGLTTADSPRFTGIELGHASDTTLTRVSAGVAAVEGKTIGTLSAAQTFTAKQTFGDTVKLDEVLEKCTVEGTQIGSGATLDFDWLTQSVLFKNNATGPAGNWTLNIRGDGTPTTLNSKMADGESVTLTLLVTQGATGYLPTTFKIDGTTISTVKVLGGTAWTADASCINAFTYTIIKTADATFTVLASKSKYA